MITFHKIKYLQLHIMSTTNGTQGFYQTYTYRVLQTIQMKSIPLCVWAQPAILGSTKTALKFKYEIQIQCMGHLINVTQCKPLNTVFPHIRHSLK